MTHGDRIPLMEARNPLTNRSLLQGMNVKLKESKDIEVIEV